MVVKMSREYGYVRVSTREQNEDRQLIAMAEAGVREENIIVEKQSGKDFERPNYRKLLRQLKELFERLGRSLANSWEMCYQEAKNYFELHGDLKMLMCGKVTHKNLIDNRPLFRYYSSIWIEKTSLIQYNKVSGRYLYEGKNTNH